MRQKIRKRLTGKTAPWTAALSGISAVVSGNVTSPGTATDGMPSDSDLCQACSDTPDSYQQQEDEDLQNYFDPDGFVPQTIVADVTASPATLPDASSRVERSDPSDSAPDPPPDVVLVATRSYLSSS